MMELIKDEILEIEIVDEKSEFMDIHTRTENYLANGILVHNCKPSKRAISLGEGTYLPDVLRESIEIVVSIDTSGSIGQEELKEFLTEVLEISRAFTNIKMDILIGDAELQGHYTVTNNNQDEILSMKIAGYGGTSHEWVRAWLKDNRPNAKIWVCLTDGYSDLQTVIPQMPETLRKIIVLSKRGVPEAEMEPYGEVVKLV